MSSELFRFVSIRSPRPAAPASASQTIDLGRAPGRLIAELRRARADASRAALLRVAKAYTVSPDFVTGLDQAWIGYLARLDRLPGSGFQLAAAQALSAGFGQEPADYVRSDAFKTLLPRSSDSLVTAIIDTGVKPRNRALLVRLARGLWLVERLAHGEEATLDLFRNAPLVVPTGIFPLPSDAPDLKGLQAAQAEAEKAALQARRETLAQTAANLAAQQAARDELLQSFELTGPQPAGRGAGRPSGFLLSESATAALSGPTKAALARNGLPTDQVDVAKSVALLEKSSAALAAKLYANTGSSRQMVKIGANFLPDTALDGGGMVLGLPDPITRMPGPCATVLDPSPPHTVPTVPTGTGTASVLGIADLLVVEQELLRYEMGEVAHVENVLRSEVRSRRFKTTDTIQTTDTTETETTTDKEQDLSTSQRFELQTESQTVITQNASTEAGLTIHASYGPSVDATANYNASSSTSTQQSNTAASNYAQEITSKAVQRVQTRTLTSRTVTKTSVVEEINEHAFDNKQGGEDIVGIYRYLNKVYQAQVVRYGKRLMLEFIVPEPAAFLRYAMSNKPVNSITSPNPDPPGYCVNGQTFQQLQASEITRDNYLYWASKYGARDVNPPPASVLIASNSKKAPDQMPSAGDRLLSSDTFDVQIPDGYLCQSAFVNIYGETQEGKHQIVFQLQEQQGEYVEPIDDGRTWTLHLLPTAMLTVTINSVGFHNYEVLVTVFCSVSIEKFQDWQLKTFSSIMGAYNDLKSAYDQAVAEARLQSSDAASFGDNPALHRATEQVELKKGCISLLTAQRFDLFDAVARNVAPYGYPEIDFEEAQVEGEYISFIEKSFEWANMVYLFYPYFWGRKDDWASIVQIRDIDPLFAQFLQAGAARVKVPVRVGFWRAVLTHFNLALPPSVDGVVLNGDELGPDDPQLSIIDELKSQEGDNNVDAPGRLNVTHGAATVTGADTNFSDNDASRRIVIAGSTYVIQSVEDPRTITLSTPYAGQTAQGIGYALGGVLVGQSWPIKLPTNLVKLDHSMVIS